MINETVKKYYNNTILQQACSGFNIKLEDAKLIRGNGNLIYICGDKVLRISHSDIRTFSDIEAEINWLIFLKAQHLPVVDLVLSTFKSHLIQIGDVDNHFTVVCFHKIVGEKISKENWNGKHFQSLGKLTGQLHKVGNQYPQKDHPAYKDWDTIFEFDAYKHLPEDDRALKQLHQEIVAQINQLPKTMHNYGLIHYDIHQENYLLTEQNANLMLFDFEMTCKSWFINDVATVLYYANRFPKSADIEAFESHFMTHFWKGYEQEYTINQVEKNWIPKFLLYRDLMLYGFLSNLWKEKALSPNEVKLLNRIQQSIKVRRKAINV